MPTRPPRLHDRGRYKLTACGHDGPVAKDPADVTRKLCLARRADPVLHGVSARFNFPIGKAAKLVGATNNDPA